MKRSRSSQGLRARGFVRALAWLLLLLTGLPPLHLVFPDGGCHGSGADVGAALRADHAHSLLDCRLCLDLLQASAIPGPSAPTAGLPLLMAATCDSAAERLDAVTPARSWSPRAPPALLG